MKFKNYIEVQSGIKDSANSPGTLDQVLTSTATGVAWVDPSTISAEAATLVVIECKNTSGATITKGTPVYQTGTVGATDVIEIAVADASDEDKMAAIGLLQTTLNNNGFGKVVITGELLNITTSPIDGVTPTTGDTIYVKPGGGLTLTKPTGVNFIQNVGLVGKVSGGNAGSITVSSIMRTNDVPNLTTGKIWVGTATNTAESATVYLDEPNGRMGIGTTSPTSLLEISKQLSAASTIDYPYTISSRDDGNLINQVGGEGVGIKFRIAGNAATTPGDSLVGASIAAIRESASDTDSSTGLGFFVTQNDETLDEALRIDHNGNVGIGTTSPTQPFQVDAGSNIASFRSVGIGENNKELLIQTGGDRVTLDAKNADDGTATSLSFELGNSEKARLTTIGLGIGTTSPSQKLDVDGSVNIDGTLFVNTNNNHIRLIDTDNTGNFSVGVNSNFQIRDITANTTPLIIRAGTPDDTILTTASGRVGISQNSPGTTLHVGGFTRIDGGLQMNTANATIYQILDSALRFGTNNTERMRITNTGQVGIGITAITASVNADDLQIGNGTGGNRGLTVTAQSNSGAAIYFGDADNTNMGSVRYDNSNDSMKFFTNTSEQMRITSTGNVGIGTTSPSVKLEVKGSHNDTLARLFYNNGTDANNAYIDMWASEPGVTYNGSGIGSNINKSPYYGRRVSAQGQTYIRFLDGQFEVYTGTNSSGTASTAVRRFYIEDNGLATFSTTPAVGTRAAGDNSTRAASTAFVTSAISTASGNYLPLSAGSSYPLTGDLAMNNNIGIITKDSSGAFRDILKLNSTNVLEIGSSALATDAIFKNTGNVGIGATSPGYKLDVDGDIRGFGSVKVNSAADGDPYLALYQNGTEKAYFQYVDSGDNLVLQSDGIFTFKTATAERVRITAGGRVGIGVTNPSAKLQVEDSANNIQMRVGSLTAGRSPIIRLQGRNSANTTNYYADIELDANDGKLIFNDPGTSGSSIGQDPMVLDSSGNVGIGTTSPGYKLDVSESVIVGSASTATNSNNIENLLIVKGKNNYSNGVTWYGDYGQILLSATNNMTSSARQFLITNALDNNKFAIIRSTDWSTRPVTNSTSSGVDSGHADFVIDNAGNVGIGTTSPGYKLDVSGEARFTGDITVGNTAGSQINMLRTSANYINATNNTGYLVFRTGGYNTALTLDASQNATFAGDLTVSGGNITLGGTGRIQGVDTVSASTDATNKAYVDNAIAGTLQMVKFNRSGINSSTYTMLATVNGNNLASILKMTMTGTSGNVVFACTFDITVNHSQDIHVKSSNGDYTEVTLRITSDNNEDFSIEAKHNGSSTTTAEVCIYPLADEIVTPTTTDPGYTGAEYEHTATEGWRYGGEDNGSESSNVIIDGKVGIGTTSPTSPLTIKSNSTSSSSSGLTIQSNGNTNNIIELAEKSGDSARLQMYDAGVAKIALYTDGTNNYINAGNVGIGTTSPGAKLEVNGQTVINSTGLTEGFQWFNDTNEIFSLEDTSGAGELLLLSSNSVKVKLNANGTSYFNGGYVGIGTTSPSADLHIQGSSETDVPILRVGGFGNSGSKLELTETLASGNMTYGYSFFNDGNSSNTLIIKAHNNSTTGITAMTIDRGNALTTFGPVPVVGTRTAGDNTTRAASTAFVTSAISTASGNYLPLAAGPSYPLTGTLYGTGATFGDTTVDVATVTIEGGQAGILDIWRNGTNASYQAIRFRDDTNANTEASIGWGSNQLRLNGTSTIVATTGGAERMRIDSSGNVGINNTSPVNGKLVVTSTEEDLLNTVRIVHTRSDSNFGSHALEVDMNLSGADTTTADRTNRGIYVDLDSSADGDAANEHRIHGIESDVRFTGFSDIARGGYFLAESNYTGGKTAQLVGVYGYAIHDANDAAGGVSNMYGSYGLSSIQDTGDVDQAFGVYGLVDIGDNRGNADVGVTKAVEGEISINKASTISYGTMIGISSIIDNNEGSVPNFGNQYLFKGDYQGTRGNNAWGIYTEGDKNYFEGNVGIGTTSPGAKLSVSGDVVLGEDLDRPVKYSANDGNFRITPNNGGWSTGYFFNNQSQAFLGGFGALGGSNDSFSYFWIGDNYNDTTMVIEPSAGNVGIGTTSPNLKLDVISGTNNGIRISATDTASNWRDIDIRSYVSQAQANALPDGSAIYTTNPTSQTETAFSKFGGLVLQGRDDGNSSFAIRLGNGNGYATRMFMGATGATVFSNTVTATNFILSSDERLKENVEKICDNRVKADWKTFELKTDKGQKRYGVIAQELEKTNPEFVREDSQGFKSVAYIDLLIAKIAELEARLEKLEK